MASPLRALFAALSVQIATFGCAADPGEVASDEETSEHESGVSGVVDEGVVLRVTASALNLRAGPSTSHEILDVLDEGALITTVATSGGDGWVNVETATNDVGWVSAKHVVKHGGGGSTETCDPDRADGVLNPYQQGLHDAIAFAEGTRDYAKDGYNVMFSFKLFSSCQSHPNICQKFGNTCSTAAGRYQFLNTTWKSVKSAKGLGSFEPENQERGAAYLVETVRKVKVPADRPMTASEFSNAMTKLSWEWASLPPGQYGQPSKSMSQMRNMYCGLVGC